MDIFIQQLINGLVLGSMYALVALGYTMVYGIIELINFAHGDLFMLGAVFTYFVLTAALGAEGSSPRNWGMLVLVLILVMTFCASLNVLIERLAYRRLRDAPKLAPLITAVGVSFILQFIGLKWNGSAPRNFTTVVPAVNFDVAGVIIPMKALLVVGLTIPLLLVLVFLVNKTRQGRAMRAIGRAEAVLMLVG